MKRDDWVVGTHAVRPMGELDRCFYCKQKVGEEHKKDCVIRTKTMVVDFTFRTVIPVPEHWSYEEIDFHYNESSWCADNILADLQKRSEEIDCACFICEAETIRDATEEDEEKFGMNFIKEQES